MLEVITAEGIMAGVMVITVGGIMAEVIMAEVIMAEVIMEEVIMEEVIMEEVIMAGGRGVTTRLTTHTPIRATTLITIHPTTLTRPQS